MKIEFSTDNAAFEEYGKNYQIAVILDIIMARIKRGEIEGSILDVNGNKIGEWAL